MAAVSVVLLNRAPQPGDSENASAPTVEWIAPAGSVSADNPRPGRLVPAPNVPVWPADWSDLEVGQRIEFTLPSLERHFGVVTERREGRVSTSFSGNLEGDGRFHFTLTTGPSARFGTINTPDGVFEITTAGGATWFYPREPSRFAPHRAETDAVHLQPRIAVQQPPVAVPPPPPESP